MLKFVNPGCFQIIRVQNLIEKIRLCHDFRNVCNRCNGSNLFHQVATCLAILFSCKVGKLYAVHQGIKAHRLGVIFFWGNQRR